MKEERRACEAEEGKRIEVGNEVAEDHEPQDFEEDVQI